MIRRLQRWWVRLMAPSTKNQGTVTTTEPPLTSLESTVTKAVPEFDLVTCQTCEQSFYRAHGLHPDTACIDCQMRDWDVWHANYEARQAVNGQMIRRMS